MLSLRTNNYPALKNDRAFYNLLDDFFGEHFFSPSAVNKVSDYGSTFKIDVKDNDNAYLIEAELPGVDKGNIGLEYKDNRLYISVSKSEEVNEEKGNYIHKERRSESMHRAVYLDDIDSANISAKLENGVLKVEAPKLVMEESQHKIEIQ